MNKEKRVLYVQFISKLRILDPSRSDYELCAIADGLRAAGHTLHRVQEELYNGTLQEDEAGNWTWWSTRTGHLIGVVRNPETAPLKRCKKLLEGFPLTPYVHGNPLGVCLWLLPEGADPEARHEVGIPVNY